MKLKNVLIVVNDIEKSITFYKELFGLNVILNNVPVITCVEDREKFVL